MTEESRSFVVANTCATSASHWPSREKRKPRYLNGDVGASLASACLLIVMLDVSGSVLLPKSQAEISDFVAECIYHLEQGGHVLNRGCY